MKLWAEDCQISRSILKFLKNCLVCNPVRSRTLIFFKDFHLSYAGFPLCYFFTSSPRFDVNRIYFIEMRLIA